MAAQAVHRCSAAGFGTRACRPDASASCVPVAFLQASALASALANEASSLPGLPGVRPSPEARFYDQIYLSC